MRPVVVVLLAIFSPFAFSQSIVNPYQYDRMPSSDYQRLLSSSGSCDQKLIPAYTGDLVIDSKYDQSDSSKSSLSSDYDASSLKKVEHIRQFMSFVAQQSWRAIYSGSESERAKGVKCVAQNMRIWARDSALLRVQTSPTGVAQRKWFLAAVSSTLMQLDARYEDYSVTSEANDWLDDLAYQVIDDYNPRLVAQSKNINNHDYWAAWAVAARSVLNDDAELLSWSESVFDYAMNQVVIHQATGLGYLPKELERGSLAANYHNYAMVPLMYLADVLVVNGVDIDSVKAPLKALAGITTRFIVSPGSLDSYIGSRQKTVSEGKRVWILPYAAVFGKDELINQIVQAGKVTTEYSQMGGDLWDFYSGRISQ